MTLSISLPVVMPAIIFLPECFIQRNGTGHTDIQRMNNTYLWNNKISICQCPDLITDTTMFIPKNQRNAFCKIISYKLTASLLDVSLK